MLFNDGQLTRELRQLGVPTCILDERRHSAAALVAWLTRFLRAHEVDVIHTHRVKDNVLGSLAARLAGVPHVIRTVHGLTEPMRGWARARYAAYEAIDKAMLRACADRVVAVSRGTAGALGRTGYPRRALATVHNGIDLGRVKPSVTPAAVRQALGIDAGAFLVGTAGRLVPVKGHEYLIRAAGYLAETRPDVRVLIAGWGPRGGAPRAGAGARRRAAVPVQDPVVTAA